MAGHKVSREKRERELKTLAEYPSGRQSLLSILMTRRDSESAMTYYQSSQQIIDAILAVEFPEAKPAGTSDRT